MHQPGLLLLLLSLRAVAPTIALSSSSTVRRFYAALNDAVDARLPATFDRPVVEDQQDLPVATDFRNDLLTSISTVDAGGNDDRNLPDCLLVCLEEKDAAVIDRMWRAMESVFSEEQQDPCPADGFHRQTLSRDDCDDAAEQTASGYDYIHFPPVNDNDAEHLRKILREERRLQDVRDAFDLICQIGRYFSAAHLAKAGAAGVPVTSLQQALRVVARLLDSDDQGDNSGSFQRLAQYYYYYTNHKQLHQQANRNASSQMESIRPHCDWSFATLVPVSAVTGLEIYNGNVWIRPEEVARRHYYQHLAPHLSSGDENKDIASSSTLQWQSRYIVVLSGKWLEILTDGAIRSTIHRVVRCCGDSAGSENSSPAARRMSAPLFLRSTLRVSEDAEDLVWEAGDDDGIAMETARKRMSDFLVTYGTAFCESNSL